MNEKIKKSFKELIYIKNALEKYFKDINKDEINKISNIIEKITNGTVSNYKQLNEDIDSISGDLKDKADKVYEVQKLKIFHIFFFKI